MRCPALPTRLSLFNFSTMLLVAFSVLTGSSLRVLAATNIVVNTTHDNIANDGLGTLRGAITAANTGAAAGECAAGSGSDTISFNVTGAGSDFEGLDWTAAHEATYNHDTGGGAYNDGSSVDDIREELEAASFACGDIVSFLVWIPVDAAACGSQALDFQIGLTADTTGRSGAAFTDITTVQVNYGVIAGGFGEGLDGVDSGISDDGGSTAIQLDEWFTPVGAEPYDENAILKSTIRVDDLEAGETVVVRIDAKLSCQPFSSPTGNLEATLESVQTSYSSCNEELGTVPGVAQTIPLKQISLLQGVGEPYPRLLKSVTSEAGTCPGTESIGATACDSVRYCYELRNDGTEPLYNLSVVDDASTPADTSDDFLVGVTGGEDINQDGSSDDLQPGTLGFGDALRGFPATAVGSYTNTATSSGENSAGVIHTDSDTATVVVEAVDNCGPTAADSTISGRVTDADGAGVAGVIVNLSGTQMRKSITDANGFYSFANVETGGFYTVTPAHLGYSFGPASRSFSQLGNSTEAAFTATLNGTVGGNVINTPEYFVRQHYLDFLGREPDESGFNFWSDQILSCGSDFNCVERRTINVSAAYFLSIEFQETGGLVDGLYRASFARAPLFSEFGPDTAAVAKDVIVGNADWRNKLTANKQEFVEAWVARPAFRAAYDTLSNASYVDALVGNTRVEFPSAERAALIAGLDAGTLTRAAVLQRVAENEDFVKAKFNEAFVRMQYFGYLRRDPDADGFDFWLRKLNDFGGNFEQAEMVKAFISSGEYRARFVR